MAKCSVCGSEDCVCYVRTDDSEHTCVDCLGDDKAIEEAEKW